MSLHHRQPILVAFIAFCSVLNACGSDVPVSVHVPPTRKEAVNEHGRLAASCTPLTVRAVPHRSVSLGVCADYAGRAPLAGRQEVAANVRALETAEWVLAVARGQIAEAVTTRMKERDSRSRLLHSAGPDTPVAASASLESIRQCIKDHESGNYAESSHIGSGSGAYQYVPGTWRTWSARAGYGGYRYAYQAPPEVQDAVTDYALTHGGAGNWSPRYGNDPCTVGIGG